MIVMGDDHDGEDDAGGEHPEAERGPLKEGQEPEVLAEDALDVIAEEGSQDEDAPEAVDDARDGGEELD